MTRKEIRQLIDASSNNLQVANVYMTYNDNYYNLIPLLASERLFLAANEDDFILDGFRISRLADVKEMRIKRDKCDEIIRSEALLDHLCIPEIDLENWQTVFEGFKRDGTCVIVEYETPEGKDDNLTIGKIDRVYKSCLYMYAFDADGIWDTEPYRISYTEVTSVTFDSRYINFFKKYIAEPPTK